jgi:Flp pilus assembly pilin Flp
MFRRRARGQGMTEYVIIVGVVAVLSIVIVVAFGNQIRNWFFVAGTQLSGEDGQGIENKMGSGSDMGIKDLGGGGADQGL